MQFCKRYSYIPVRHFLLVSKENAGIKTASVCERANVRAKYASLSKREFEQIKPYVEEPEKWDQNSHNVLIATREKLFRLATIYYREVDGNNIVIDIHYHINPTDNGYRSIEETKTIVNEWLAEWDFEKQLVMGEYARTKKRTCRNTPGVKHHKKTYVKL